jgi:hypothetical protein
MKPYFRKKWTFLTFWTLHFWSFQKIPKIGSSRVQSFHIENPKSLDALVAGSRGLPRTDEQMEKRACKLHTTSLGDAKNVKYKISWKKRFYFD